MDTMNITVSTIDNNISSSNMEDSENLSIQSIFYLILGGLGGLGNGLTLIVFLSSQSLRNKQINIFLINQSVADFLCCVVLMITYKDTVGREIITIYLKKG